MNEPLLTEGEQIAFSTQDREITATVVREHPAGLLLRDIYWQSKKVHASITAFLAEEAPDFNTESRGTVAGPIFYPWHSMTQIMKAVDVIAQTRPE